MGCDIHLFVEVKTKNGWEVYTNPKIKRNYTLFTKMAGVRKRKIEDIVPISEPKGLPSDMTYVASMSFQTDKYHSMSYLNRGEILQLYDFVQDNELGDLEGTILNCYLEGNSFAGDLPEWMSDIRFVFWFDN